MNSSSFPLDGKYLGTISADFVKVADTLRDASYLISKQEAYAYPIFVMARVPLSIGALLIEKNEVSNEWYYYAAYLEVLIQYGLIAEEKAEEFRKAYKNPEEFCCLLVVDETFTNFVYMPYPVD